MQGKIKEMKKIGVWFSSLQIPQVQSPPLLLSFFFSLYKDKEVNNICWCGLIVTVQIGGERNLERREFNFKINCDRSNKTGEEKNLEKRESYFQKRKVSTLIFFLSHWFWVSRTFSYLKYQCMRLPKSVVYLIPIPSYPYFMVSKKI